VSPVKRVQSVRAACQIIEAISAMQPVGVTEIAEKTGLDISATQRVLETLHEEGWIHMALNKKTRWQLSAKVFGLGRHVTAAELIESAPEVMERLRDETSESVFLAALEGTDLVLVRIVEGRQLIRMSSPVGTRFPVKGSAGGLAVMAHLPTEVVQRFAGVGRTSEVELEAQLLQVREKGFALVGEDVYEGVVIAAAAVLDASDYPIGALLIAAMSTRVDETTAQRLGDTVARGAQLLSAQYRSFGTVGNARERGATLVRAEQGRVGVTG
jgi:DNA-binding IclR family transcriptional regulator